MMDMNGWGNSQNINSLTPGDRFVGKIFITIGSTVDEMEFMIDLNQLADKFGIEVTDIQTIQAQYSRIGAQWLQTAGASTGVWLGLAICLTVVGTAWIRRKRGVV